MTDFDKLPKRVQRVIERCRSGQRLCKQIRKKETGEPDITFIFEPSGRRAPPKSSAAAIETGLMSPLGDGLFGNETSQTWVAA